MLPTRLYLGQIVSFELLNALNGGNKGAFARFLEKRKTLPNICWYPSAGNDFRDLLYLSRAYANYHPASEPDPVFPDLYLHTDYFPWGMPEFLDRRLLHLDRRTMISVDTVEELPRLDLPLGAELVHFPQVGPISGRVFYFTLDVHSSPLQACFKAHLLYAFVENAAFCSAMLMKHQARIPHVLHIRYGGGICGGGTAAGGWLRRVLPRLSCKMFITDGRHDDWQNGDTAAIAQFPNLDMPPDTATLRPIRHLPASGWSNYGDVSWFCRS